MVKINLECLVVNIEEEPRRAGHSLLRIDRLARAFGLCESMGVED
jgi:hypothetical protein